MITETAKSHGSFFYLLFEQMDSSICIKRLGEFGSGYYLLNNKIPIYLKMSSKRKGPWTFNFIRHHQVNQQILSEKFGECFTCLVCGKDGVAGLSMSDLRVVLDGNFEEQESVSVRRKLKAMYNIKGRDGTLKNRVSRRSIFDKLRHAVREGAKT